MILRLLKSTGIKGLLINLLVVSLFWWVSFFSSQPLVQYPERDPMLLYGMILRFAEDPMVLSIIALALFIVITFLIVNLNTSLFFIQERTYLPSLIYILFCSVFTGPHSMTPAIPAALLLLPAIRRMMDAYRHNGTAFCFFDAGLFIGTGILFYADSIWFGVLLAGGVVTLRGYNFREILLSLTGLAVPFLVVTGYMYAFGSDPRVLYDVFIENISHGTGKLSFSKLQMVPVSISLLIMLASLLFVLPRINNMKIRSGKVFVLLNWILVISALLAIFSPGPGNGLIYLAGIPACYIITFRILNSKKRAVSEIMLFTLFAAALASQLLGFL